MAAELLLGHPLFPGDTGVDQLVEIIKVLGTPTKEEVEAMNPHYTEFKFPQVRPLAKPRTRTITPPHLTPPPPSPLPPFPFQIRAYPWTKIFRPRATPEARELISSMLVYVPSSRVTMLEACGHRFFDEVRHPGFSLPGGAPLPPLFNFSEEELVGATAELRDKLVPPHARAAGWVPQRAMANVPPPYDPAAHAAAYAEEYKSGEQKERDAASVARTARDVGGAAGGMVESGAGAGVLGGGDRDPGGGGAAAGGAAAAQAPSLPGASSQRGASKGEAGAPARPGERRSP